MNGSHNDLVETVMKLLVTSAFAALGLVFASTVVNAHGHVVTGPALYATPPSAGVVGKGVNATPPHRVRAAQHDARQLRATTAD